MKTEPMEFYVGARVAPLGLRFWDPLACAFVSDGLRVTAYPVADPTRRVAAITGRSAIYVFHKLPGMGDVERGEGDAAFWQNPPANRAYVVEVEDELGRFVPFQIAVNAPVRGSMEWTAPAGVSLPPSPPGAVPLFSAATRPVPAGRGVIRAALWDPVRSRPAAWAVITAKVGNQSGVLGVADAQGQVLLMFPYPGPEGTGIGGLQAVPLTQQTWGVELAAWYAPGAGEAPARARLAEVIAQEGATLWEKWDDGNPAARVVLSPATLKMVFGEELVARTTVGGAPGAVMHVTAP
jgi:hypothetical protein